MIIKPIMRLSIVMAITTMILTWTVSIFLCASYIFARLGVLPSEWIITLTPILGIASTICIGLTISKRIHEREQYLRTRIRYSDHIYRREAERHAAARLTSFSSMSHDMRQPLQVMTTSLALLKGHTRDPDVEKHVDRLIQANATLTDFVDGLLDVSRLDTGLMAPRLRSFAVDPLLYRLVTEYRDIAAAKGLELRYVRTRIHLHSDPALLERILRNLLSNAVNYTDSGRILLGCRRRRNSFDIQVLDTGPGIAPFIQASLAGGGLSPPRESGRSGLGLFIVTELASILGHRMSLTSEAERGSCFSLSVCLEPACAESRDESSPFDRSAMHERRILLIGASDALSTLGPMLQKHGLIVEEVNSLRQALNLLDAGHMPDLAIIEHSTTNRTGPDLLERLEHLLVRPIPAIVIAPTQKIKEIHVATRLDRVVICPPVDNDDLFQAAITLLHPGRQPTTKTSEKATEMTQFSIR